MSRDHNKTRCPAALQYFPPLIVHAGLLTRNMRTAAAVFLACAFGVVAAAALPNFCPEVDYLGE